MSAGARLVMVEIILDQEKEIARLNGELETPRGEMATAKANADSEPVQKKTHHAELVFDVQRDSSGNIRTIVARPGTPSVDQWKRS